MASCALNTPEVLCNRFVNVCFRYLEIGRDAHKLIDAKVQKSDLELVSEAFQFG